MSEKKVLHWVAKIEGADFINISVNGWPTKLKTGDVFADERIPAAYPHLFEAVYEDTKKTTESTGGNDCNLGGADSSGTGGENAGLNETGKTDVPPTENTDANVGAGVVGSTNVEAFTEFARNHTKEECDAYLQPLHYTVVRDIATYYGVDTTGAKKATITLIIEEL